MTWRDALWLGVEGATVAAAGVFASAVLVFCLAMLIEAASAPRQPDSPYPACLARCEDVMDPDHRPAGWVVLDPDPCTCGLVLEVSDG
jgi:hypothetical protein